MRKVAIITARGGSKGLVDKNMLMVYGKPLIAYTIENALDSAVFDEVILTTDSEEYISALSHYPITMHRRPDYLASDTATSYDALREVIDSLKLGERYDYFVLFQPTNPLRLVEHTVDLCQQFEARSDRFDFAASVSVSSKPLVLLHAIDDEGAMSEWNIDYSTYRRQNYPIEYAPNGLYFVAKIAAYLEQKHFYGPRSMAYKMDKKWAVDIDDRDDFERFYFLVAQSKREELLHAQVLKEVRRLHPALVHEAELTLIGDSFASEWELSLGVGRELQDLSIAAISTREYPELVLAPGTRIADRVLLAIGRDDLRKQRCQPAELVEHTLELIRAVRRINPKCHISVLELPKTHFRVDCDNRLWDEFNPLMQSAVAILSELEYIPLNEKLCNAYGKLDIQYTTDGYNLNRAAYALVEQELRLH